MTPRAYLDAVRKRCEAATAGPWRRGIPACDCADAVQDAESSVMLPNGECIVPHALDADAEFVKHARTDLPKLERIARLAEDYREAVRKGNIESISADETRCALFAALEELK